MKLTTLLIFIILLAGCSNQLNENNSTDSILNDMDNFTTNETPQTLILPITSTSTVPVVGIHVSEKSTSKWNEIPFSKRFEGHASLQIILDSQKIPYDILSDKDIKENKLFINQKVKYPIVFSINNPTVDQEVADKINTYVKQNGTFFFNANSFTKNNCFMLDVEISCIEEFFKPDTAQKVKQSKLLEHIPSKEVVWTTPHVVALVNSSKTAVTNSRQERTGAMIIIDDGYIYHSNFRPFWARAQGNPNSMNTFFAMNVIKDSFEKHNLPVIQINPWGEYEAAFMQRFDVEPPYDDLLELFPTFVNISKKHNIPAVFYMLVDQVQAAEFSDISGWQVFRVKNPKVTEMMLNASDGGMIVASHSTWHLGPDVDVKPKENIKQSLDILEEILKQRPMDWVSPNLLGQKHSSLQLIDELEITTAGEQMITHLPHYGISPDDGSRFKALQLPVSTTFNHGPTTPNYFGITLENQVPQNIERTVDLYYENNGLINIYAHLVPENVNNLEKLYTYVNTKDDIWITTPQEILGHWTAYDKLSITNVSANSDSIQFTLENTGNQTTAHFNIPGKIYANQNLTNGSVEIGSESIMITVELKK